MEIAMCRIAACTMKSLELIGSTEVPLHILQHGLSPFFFWCVRNDYSNNIPTNSVKKEHNNLFLLLNYK